MDMKLFFTCFWIFVISLCFSQNTIPVDTVIKGKKYLVYPFLAQDESFDFNYNYSIAEIPPVLDSLPDGHYLLLKKNKNKKFLHAKFSIKNGLFEDTALMYDQKGREISNGFYHKGIREGRWITNTKKYYNITEYKDGKINGLSYSYYDGVLSDSGMWVNNLQEGPHITRFKNGRVFSEINYKSGVQDGLSRMYSNEFGVYYLVSETIYKEGEVNGLIKSYLYSTEKGKSYLYLECEREGVPNIVTPVERKNKNSRSVSVQKSQSSLWKYKKYYKLYYANGTVMIDMKTDSLVSTDFNGRLLFKENLENSIEENTSVYNIHSDKKNDVLYSLPLNHPFNVFHDNGQLKVRNYIVVDSSRSYLDNVFDTVFTVNSNVDFIKRFIGDSSKKNKVSIEKYDDLNKLNCVSYYVKVENYFQWQKYLEIVKGDTVFYSPLILALNKIEKHSNAPALIKREIKSDHLIEEYATFWKIWSPLVRNTTKRDTVLDFRLISLDRVLVYSKIYKSNELKITSYCSSDSNYTIKNKGVSSNHVAGEVWLYSYLFSEADSVFIRFKNEFFNGKVVFVGEEKSAKKNKIKRNKIYLYSPFLYGRGKGRSELCLYVKNGRITNRKMNYISPEETLICSDSLLNDELHGTSFSYSERLVNEYSDLNENSKKKKEITKSESTFIYGRGVRNRIDYRYVNKKWIPIYISAGNEDQQDITVYNIQSAITEKYLYNKSGIVYPIKSYYANGDLQSLQEGANGLYLLLNPQGDTTFCRYKEDDKIDGWKLISSNFHCNYIFDSKTRQYLVVNPYGLEDVYKNYLLYDKGDFKRFILKDEFNVTRILAIPDSLYYHDYFIQNLRMVEDGISYGTGNGEVENINNWRKLVMSGELQLFHANGRPYAKGRIVSEPGFQGILEYNRFIEVAKNPDVSMQPNLHDWHTEKIGLWTYYNSQGIKTVEIQYDTAAVGETYKEYYPSGKLKYSGYFLSEIEVLKCNDEMHYFDFDINYSSHFSENGDTLVNKGNGYLKIHDSENVLKSECNLINGEYDGWYKAYGEKGDLVEVGRYEKGKKIGRWLSGDLQGINYLSDQCFESEEVRKLLQLQVKNNLSVTEIRYENDVVVYYYIHQFTK